LKRDAVPQLHQSIGPNYIETLIEPEIGNRMREVIAEYTVLIEPGLVDLPHPALGQDLTPSPTARRAQAGTGVRA